MADSLAKMLCRYVFLMQIILLLDSDVVGNVVLLFWFIGLVAGLLRSLGNVFRWTKVDFLVLLAALQLNKSRIVVFFFGVEELCRWIWCLVVNMCFVLKGGKEARRLNAILHKIITSVLRRSIGDKLIGLVASRENIPDLLKRVFKFFYFATSDSDDDDGLFSKVPSVFSLKFMEEEKKDSFMILFKAAKFCHWTFVALIAVGVTLYGVTLYGGPRASSLLKLLEAQLLNHEYSSLACTVKIVDDVKLPFSEFQAICSLCSSHTDDLEVAETFLHRVDSAAVFHNASTRFCVGYKVEAREAEREARETERAAREAAFQKKKYEL
ncbi:delta-1-pyrroline-5-carboxylate synthase B-like [Hibiscus syriacus]|uniref:delta-1-pyrroline-5-carboxylate synthase B-like n=1 Tax=Hibiscus syriacus TaxID=106335 RepID=UPI001922DE23|nr:delta-1-pyrroline-5-carboxylate synthase B-like [Hibiscus syriacus]